MNPEIKAEWVGALRSQEFKQGRRSLAASEVDGGEIHYCCLGVLCELAARRGKTERRNREDGSGYVTYGGHGAFLPGGVMSWAGLKTESPMVPVDVLAEDHPLKRDLKKYGDTAVSLAALNDEGLTFEEIADLIDAHL